MAQVWKSNMTWGTSLASEVTNDSTIAGVTVKDALNTLAVASSGSSSNLQTVLSTGNSAGTYQINMNSNMAI